MPQELLHGLRVNVLAGAALTGGIVLRAILFAGVLAIASCSKPSGPPQSRTPQSPDATHAAKVLPAELADLTVITKPGRRVVDFEQADLDGDGTPEWVLLLEHVDSPNPGRLPSQRASYEVLIARRDSAGWKALYVADVDGDVREPMVVERLALKGGGRHSVPSVVVGAQAEKAGIALRVITYNVPTRAFIDHSADSVQFATVDGAGVLDLWWASRERGDPSCCPSAYEVKRFGIDGERVALLSRARVVAAEAPKVQGPGTGILRLDAQR